jgi:aerobic carbon-monoxide dehydrogenase medium subunit
MMLPNFDYVSPKTLTEALNLGINQPDAQYIAGGQSLLVDLKQRKSKPQLLIDLHNITGLHTIHDLEKAGLRIGAMVTCTNLAETELICQRYPALSEAARSIGDLQVRNASTLGGSLACNHPAADLPAAALALDSRIAIVGASGVREVSADEFFVGAFRTALKPGEIITALELPPVLPNTGSAYEKFKNPASGYAICGVACQVVRSGSGFQYRIAVTGLVDCAIRLPRIEASLARGSFSSQLIQNSFVNLAGELSPRSDLGASGEYRLQLVKVLAERALTRAYQCAAQP